MLLLGFAAALPAQEITGNISGTVTDTSGSAVPDAKVDLLSILTGAERSTTTTSAGVFFFNSLPVGDYKITVAKDGFKKSEVTGMHVNVNDKLTFNIGLTLGSVTESVTVTSETPVLQTETAEVSNLVGNNQMKSLPLNQRDFGQLVDLVPGVKLVGSGKNRDAVGARVKIVSDDLTQWDEVHAGGSYLSSNDPRLHYGLGKKTKVSLIEIHWPDGKMDTVANVSANNFLTIEEGKGITRATPPSVRKAN